MKGVVLLMAVTMMSGCAPKVAAPAVDADAPKQFELVDMGKAEEGKDARPDVPMVAQLDVVKLTVPGGTVSRNEAFWKRVEESAVDVGTYDLLSKNGIRVGVAPTSEWDYFADLIQKYPADYEKNSWTSPSSLELGMRKKVVTENIFYYDAGNQLVGRTYDDCDNILAIVFQPAPRHPGAVYVSMSPMIRSLRKRLDFDRMNGEREFVYYNPEYLYDANLRVDIPQDHFLIIGASESAMTHATSIGHQFLLKEDSPEQQERLVLLVPRLYRVDDPTHGEKK